MNDFGRKIKELRESKRITQKELGKILSIRNTTISAWEKDIAEPPLETIKKLCIMFDVSADYLLGLEDDFGNKTYTTAHNDFRNNSGTINTGTINNTYHTGK